MNANDEVKSKFDKLKDIAAYLGWDVAVLILCAIFVFVFSTQCANAVKEKDKFTVSAKCTIASTEYKEKKDTYTTELQYNGAKYKIDGKDAYTLCKDRDGDTVIGELTIIIYTDGDIKYEVTGIASEQ